MSAKITDTEFEEMKTNLNSAIHEIVFAVVHADNDELDDACTNLVTAQMTIDSVAARLSAAVEAGRKP